MKRTLLASVTSLLILAGCGSSPPAPVAAVTKSSAAADLILHHGCIYTVDAKQPWAEAVAVRGKRIVAVGPTRLSSA